MNKLLCTALFVSALAGCKGGNQSPPVEPATLTPEQARGKAVFNQHCSSCHSASPDTIIVGPSMAGISQRAGRRVEGMSAPDYIRTSIEDPDQFLVPGFNDLMPKTLVASMNQEDINDILAYLLTLE